MNTQPSLTSEVVDRFNQALLTMKAAALILAVVLSTSAPAQAQQPTTGNQPSHTEVDAMNTQPSRTSEVIDRFNQAFQRHDGSLLEDLIAEDCVMESVDPAPDGTRVVGRAANLKFWRNLANNRDGAFAVEDVVVFGDRANIRWRYHFGPGLSQSVRGVTLMHLRDGLIVEALAYAKSGDAAVGAAVRSASGSESR
jgi:ketosteroid isomerase-like protein